MYQVNRLFNATEYIMNKKGLSKQDANLYLTNKVLSMYDNYSFHSNTEDIIVDEKLKEKIDVL